MNRKALARWIIIGTVLQLAMIGIGHYVPFVRDNVFMLGGLGLSLIAGLGYALEAGGKWPDALLGGVIVGAACAFIGIVPSVVLGDTPREIVIIGTLSSGFTGLIGAAVGKLLKR